MEVEFPVEDGFININRNWSNKTFKIIHVYSDVGWTQNRYITKGQFINFKFMPLYDITDEVYTVYFSRKQ